MEDKDCYATYLIELEKAGKTYGKDHVFLDNNHWSYTLSISQKVPYDPVEKEQRFQLMKECLLTDLNERDKALHRYTYNLPSISIHALSKMVDNAPNNHMSPSQCAYIYKTIGPSQKNYLDLLDKLCQVKDENVWRVKFFCTMFSQPVIVEDSNRVFNQAINHLEKCQHKLPEGCKFSQAQMVEMIYTLLQNNPQIAQEVSNLDIVSRVRLIIDEKHVISLMKACKKDYLKTQMIGFSELKTYTMELNRDHLALHYEIRDESHFKEILGIQNIVWNK